jgi:hypothetical protein
MKTKLILSFLIIIVVASCDVTTQLLTDLSKSQSVNPLSQQEVTNGLKRALSLGAENAVSGLSATNGFLKSPTYKILLPKEADFITKNKDNALLQAVGIDKLIDNVEISMNLAAEKAVIKAKPIFINAITNMSIQDAFGLLRGGDTAATHFLRVTTYQQLYAAFKPEVSSALNQPVLNGLSTQKTWSNLTTAYNGVAKIVPGWNSVNSQLDDYVTTKAMNALFEQVKKEEKSIRDNPAARVDDLLKRVFGTK